MTRSLAPQDLVRAALGAASEVPPFEPPFDFKVRWAPDYDSLFRDRNLIETEPEVLLERAFKRGRVLLQSAGGTGKTSILSRLRRESADRRIVALYIDLRRWHPEMFEAWEELRDSEPQRLQLLLDTLTGPSGVDDAVIDQISPEFRALLMVDGLNEVPSGIGDSIISAIDAFARRHPRAGVIATDRLVRRPISDSHWTLATIAPLDGGIGLDGMAFFRNLALTEGETSISSADAYRRYLAVHADLRDPELAAIGEAALSVYGTTRSRTFPLSLLEAKIAPELVNRLRGVGLLSVDGDGASFRHHLIHDYLAAVYMAQDRSTWAPEGFDAITLTASSFDPLAMVLEQLPDPADADLFLRRIYDWNFYGAAYALATCRGRQSTSVSDEMQIALLAMLAERRWDPFRATAQQVSDALALFPSGIADSFLDAPDLASVFELVRSLISQGSSLRKWADVFTHPIGSPVSDNDMEALEESDSLMGWTMANVLKRSALSDRQLARLTGILADGPDPIIRWRAAHALGAHPTQVSIDALYRALDDTYHWVVYGSVRSLIEIAARSAEHRGAVLGRLRNEIDRRRSDSSIARQLSRAAILAVPPKGWADAVGPIVEDLWAAAETEERQDHWRRVAYDLRRSEEDRGNVA
jgi:hypothetical protein